MKILKKILWITDDISEEHYRSTKEWINPGNIYYGRKGNYLKFDLQFIRKFDDYDYRKTYDAVLVDYGLIDVRGDSKHALKVLRKIFDKRIPLAWVGGLPYESNKSARVDFPDEAFLHNLPSSCIGHEDVLFLLYKIFKDEQPC